MPRSKKKKKKKPPFGARLAALRRRKGLSQYEFAKKLGITQRVVTYYENEANRPPTQLLPQIAGVLEVSVDDLLNSPDVEIVKEPELDKRLLQRFKKLRELPVADQRAILRLIDSLAENTK